ncbi:hypothetical protein [Marinobacter sp.]|uniref:hypothetical protein n=1 Tax=Marinobacter sp. TaxID=50741 RepID=UPI001B7316AD|nr:hypothetical protein [Marinobacter sp.]MBQ0834607.1 hypothetical protein [Marinobacter sp.]
MVQAIAEGGPAKYLLNLLLSGDLDLVIGRLSDSSMFSGCSSNRSTAIRSGWWFVLATHLPAAPWRQL